MARRLRPLVEREAIWAFVLALLGAISMYLTLPASIVLSIRCIAGKRRGGDGSEPAIGAFALGTAWLSFLLAYPTMRTIVAAVFASSDRYRAIGFAIGWAILAGVIGLLVWFMIRSHPERWLARRLAVAGVVTIVAAGAFQLAAAGLTGRCDVHGGTLIDCVGVTPWIVMAPALAIGGTWLAVALSASALR
ncbi:MAG: hypothetical protein ACXWYI_06955, partial [Actinomycetota bacterium]